MKILHVISTFAVDYPGGITNYVRTLAAAQVAQGDEVDVLDGGYDRPWRTHPMGFRVGSIRSTSHRVHVLSNHVRAREIGEFCQLVAGELYDVVHFHLTIGMGDFLYDEMKNVGVPYFVSLHDYYLFCPRITMMNSRNQNCGGPEIDKCEQCIGVLDQIDPIYRFSRKAGITLPRILPSRSVTQRNAKIELFLYHARGVLAVSERVRELFMQRYPNIEVSVLHIGTASAVGSSLPKVVSPRLRITFLGTLSSHKGGNIFAELVERTSRHDVEFAFWGRALSADIAARLQTAGVRMNGEYTPDEIPTIMSKSDIGVVPPIWEDNAPQVMMEFLNHRVPVLGTRMGGIPDFVNASNGFLFEPTAEGVESAVAFIEELTKDDVQKMQSSIRRLTTPDEHVFSIRAAYLGV